MDAKAAAAPAPAPAKVRFSSYYFHLFDSCVFVCACTVGLIANLKGQGFFSQQRVAFYL